MFLTKPVFRLLEGEPLTINVDKPVNLKMDLV